MHDRQTAFTGAGAPRQAGPLGSAPASPSRRRSPRNGRAWPRPRSRQLSAASVVSDGVSDSDLGSSDDGDSEDDEEADESD